MKYLLLLVAVATAHGMAPCNPSSQGWTLVGTITPTSCSPPYLVPLSGTDVCQKTANPGCSSVIFPIDGVTNGVTSYSEVCGRVHGYQTGTPDAFDTMCTTYTIDQPYIDGVSITHGSSPRHHIWTLAATTSLASCPCGTNPTVTVPSFVGTDYFCDVSGNTYSGADRLWDGVGCLNGAQQCCDDANWFYKDLQLTTNDDIEFRVCTDQNSAIEDVYIEDVEIYVR